MYVTSLGLQPEEGGFLEQQVVGMAAPGSIRVGVRAGGDDATVVNTWWCSAPVRNILICAQVRCTVVQQPCSPWVRKRKMQVVRDGRLKKADGYVVCLERISH